MDEKETSPDATSGTPDMVVVEPQVMADWMAVTRLVLRLGGRSTRR
jgi:hypothetical protein